MSLYTCNNCKYTFKSLALPTSCPDCGKSTAQSKVSNGIYTATDTIPAIRPANALEKVFYQRVQTELAWERAAAVA